MRLIASSPNEKGDLFARLVADVFLSQGYENPQMNVHKTGREIDLRARHRLEDKITVAECKAHKTPIGADDLNKFAGVLDMERMATDASLTQGYFISLSGFRESARAQEEECQTQRFVLLDGPGVQEQLVAGSMVVSPELACEAAGRLANSLKIDSDLVAPPELLAHPIGWIWQCLFERNHELTHFALIHADGRAIGERLASEIIEADSKTDGILGDLSYLRPCEETVDGRAVADAERQYRSYLKTELGEITLEGLPADEEVGARHIALEDLYVPLKVEKAIEERQKSEQGMSSAGQRTEPPIGDADDESPKGANEDSELSTASEGEDPEREIFGSVLSRERRLAILAAPGAGKSTLIKRLAVAYAYPESRALIGDELPDRQWLPIFIRCRTLGDAARQPIWQIIDEIPHRGEFPDYGDGFHEFVARSLREGSVLLLIDGLDEISDPGERIAFVRQLRTFLGTYPNVGLVLTSRETGFRAVVGAMSSMCEWYKLSEFEDDDIRALTKAWHATVVGRTERVAKDAEDLASTIIATDRVRRLARNPLLLTTLLLVKRWVGDLPRKRTVLYEKAIEVLLMTWNVEAHEPIDREEAIPQLAFVAHAMTESGIQSLSSVTLTRLLTQAREQMPEILGFARTSVSQFVEQIESRSSLLVMTGHVEEAGTLVPNYEFRHLTFQEYLTAVALVEGFYDGHRTSDSLVDQLEPHFGDPEWLEVVALANVRAGRSANGVVSELLARLDADNDEQGGSNFRQAAELLARGLADEVQLPPELVIDTSRALGRFRRSSVDDFLIGEIVEGRYGEMYREVIEEAYWEDGNPEFAEFGSSFATLVEMSCPGPTTVTNHELTGRIGELLQADDEKDVTRGALLAMQMAFSCRFPNEERQEEVKASLPVFSEWSRVLILASEGGRPFVCYAAAWALVWLSEIGAVGPGDEARGLRAMLGLWRRSESLFLKKQAAWAFMTLPEVPRVDAPLGAPSVEMSEFIEEEARVGEEEDSWREDRLPAALLLAYYLGEPWDHEEIAARAKSVRGNRGRSLARLVGPPE